MRAVRGLRLALLSALLATAPQPGLAQGPGLAQDQGLALAPAAPGMAMTPPGVGMAAGPPVEAPVAPARPVAESPRATDAKLGPRGIHGQGSGPASAAGALPNQRTGPRRERVVHDICIGC